MNQTTNPQAFTGDRQYVASEDLLSTVNIAMALQKPLLIKGEPGTGKTRLALSPFFWENGRPVTIFQSTDTCIAIPEDADLGKRGGSPRLRRGAAAGRLRHLRFCKGPLRCMYLYFEILSLQPRKRKRRVSATVFGLFSRVAARGLAG